MNEVEREEYTAKCLDWFDTHPTPVPRGRAPPSNHDRELIQALFAKYPGQVPPFEERIKVYRVAGRTEEYIAKAILRHEKFLATKDEIQKVLDRIFPNVPKKTTKAPPKVIKAVKKKMPIS
jgi:hypothetical protein